MNRGIVSALTVVLVLASCHTITTHRYDGTLYGAHAKRGITYFLPKNYIKIIATNMVDKNEVLKKEQKLEDVKVKLKTEGEALKEADIALQKALMTLTKAETAYRAKPTDEGLKKAFEDAQTNAIAAKKTKDEASNAQNKTANEVASLAKEIEDLKKPGKRISIELLPTVPDLDQLFVAELNHTVMREEEVKIATTASGLLEKVSVKGEEKTGEIVEALVKTAVQVAQFFLPAPPPPPAPPARLPAEELPYHYEFIIDPANQQDLVKMNERLKISQAPYQIRITSQRAPYPSPSNAFEITEKRATGKEQKKEKKKETKVEGLIYRRSIEYIVEITDNNEKIALKDRPALKAAQLEIPNAGPLGRIEFKAGAFVTSHYAQAFKNGLLTSSESTRPSELYGSAAMLFNVTKSISDGLLESIKQLIQFRINLPETSDKSTPKEEQKTNNGAAGNSES